MYSTIGEIFFKCIQCQLYCHRLDNIQERETHMVSYTHPPFKPTLNIRSFRFTCIKRTARNSEVGELAALLIMFFYLFPFFSKSATRTGSTNRPLKVVMKVEDLANYAWFRNVPH
jgi:hypothetical protein